MDLRIHRTILYLALQRVRERIDKAKSVIDPNDILDKTFYPMWLGNWLTDMGQASAFFDVLDNKYRDPYTRWKHGGNYDFPKAIDDHKTEWKNLFVALWQEECKAVSQFDAFKPIALPDEATISDANQIGGYYPYDHFDVADRMRPLCPKCKGPMTMNDDQTAWACATAGHAQLKAGAEGAVTWQSVPDAIEFDQAEGLLSQTIRRGVFTECLWGPLHVAFREPAGRDNFDKLRALGKALHILQDLFAHSNFVEVLLLCADARGLLPTALSQALKLESVGAFAAYGRQGPASETTVATGRFDQIDTAASILKIYRENLVTRWEDLEAGGYQGKKGKTRDLMVEVLFGTFSNLPFAADALKVVKTVMGVTDFLSKVGDQITRGVISFFGWVAKQLSDDSAKDGIDKVQNLLLAANDVQAKDWANAGRIMYVERVIVKTLEDKLKSDIGRHGPKVLPHHTLLAKDQDTGQPECRLGFKIATLLAVDLTAQVLEQYLTGGDMKAVEVVLRNRIRHPETLLKDNPNIAAAFQNVVPTIYGERWWQVAGNSQAEMILR